LRYWGLSTGKRAQQSARRNKKSLSKSFFALRLADLRHVLFHHETLLRDAGENMPAKLLDYQGHLLKVAAQKDSDGTR
jgi:hypothetical protein